MAEKKQNPVVIGILIVIIVGALFINVKKMMGPRSRARKAAPPADYIPSEPEMPPEFRPEEPPPRTQGPQPQVQPQAPMEIEEKKPEKKFTMPTIKVELRQLTSGSAYDTQPVFSPNGREIAFVSFNKGRQNIRILKLNSSEEAKDLTQGNYLDSHPSWAPDGNKIIFSSNRQGKDTELFWLDKFTGDINSLNKKGTDPAFSPDGELLAFVEERNIWIMRLSTKEFYPITKDGYNAWPCWTRDGKNVYFSSSGLIKVTDNKGSEAASITSSGFSDYPAVSLTDNRLVYVSLESGRYDLWMMNSDGSGKTQLTGDEAREYFPSWSPDGNSIVFASNASGLSNLWVLTLPEK